MTAASLAAVSLLLPAFPFEMKISASVPSSGSPLVAYWLSRRSIDEMQSGAGRTMYGIVRVFFATGSVII
jgi:hypothetical protein